MNEIIRKERYPGVVQKEKKIAQQSGYPPPRYGPAKEEKEELHFLSLIFSARFSLALRFSFGREGILLLISLFLTLSASFPRSSGLVWSNLHVSCLLPSPSSPLHHHLHPQQQLSRSRVPLFLPYRRRSRGRCKIFAGYRLFISYLCVPALLLPLLLLCTERPRVKCLRYGTHYTHTHRTPNACSRV